MFLSIIVLLLLQYPLLPKKTPLFAHLTPFIPTKSYLTHQIAPKRAWNQDKKSDLQQNKVCWELTIYPRPANFTQVYLCCLLHFPCLNDGCCNASATELLKVEDVRTHVCANLLRVCAKFVLLNAKPEKQAFLFMIFAQFDKILQNLTWFYGNLGPFLWAKFSVRKFSCAKELSFRRSVYWVNM